MKLLKKGTNLIVDDIKLNDIVEQYNYIKTPDTEIVLDTTTGLFDNFFVATGFTGNGYIEWEAKGSLNANYTIGLDPTLVNIDRNVIDYGIQLNSANQVYIKESGVSTLIGGYVSGDIFKIERVGTNIYYYQNEVLIHNTNTVPTTLLNIAMNGAQSVVGEIILNLSVGTNIVKDFIDSSNATLTEINTIKSKPLIANHGAIKNFNDSDIGISNRGNTDKINDFYTKTAKPLRGAKCYHYQDVNDPNL